MATVKNRIDNNEIYLFVKGILCNSKGVYLYMKFLNLDFNKLNNQTFKNITYFPKISIRICFWFIEYFC